MAAARVASQSMPSNQTMKRYFTPRSTAAFWTR
jgi:hypothetical protein